MTKNEMKTIGVAIMIMLGFSQANYNSPLVKIGPNRVYDKLSCRIRCELACAPLIPGGIAYIICLYVCASKCHEQSNDVDNYIIGHGSTNSINVNIGI
ncbi:hypothetical protein D0Y65_000837 [Glycine soja]|uniref:Uncharacterized protein n=1 Tax=Glycine soja TaxID=3848 RepID=A0A445M0E9_GLYSO|nr:hypothetical protein D0Y65_000837 [Glycine soja]